MIFLLRGRHCHKVYSGELFIACNSALGYVTKLTGSLSSFIFQMTSLSTNYIFCKPYIIFQTHLTYALYANLRIYSAYAYAILLL